MKLKTKEENGLLSVHLEAEDRDESDFLRRVHNTHDEADIILHRDPGFHFPTLTFQVKQ